jgi:carboxyl-terminal processing protease
LCIALLLGAPCRAQADNKWRDDALALPEIINSNYAYLDRLPDGRFALTPRLQALAEAVNDETALLDFAEKALLLLADHHAITGSAFDDSWAVVPAFSALWIERRNGKYFVTDVRESSAASNLGIVAGFTIESVDGKTIAQAVDDFWSAIGVTGVDDARAGFAARILVAGRRDRSTTISLGDAHGRVIGFTLPSQYTRRSEGAGVRSHMEGLSRVIVIDDALGDSDTIAAFDQAMIAISVDTPLIIDLTNTPSGGNTTVARAIMGWFVDRPRFYQTHRSPVEERRTGIARQWTEQVLPRAGKYHPNLPVIRVGRWTGSMGEGLAIGFAALGAKVQGRPMAGLLGAIEDIELPASKLVVKLPTERLMTIDGMPREQFAPLPMGTP